jgi:hypothetical protein
MRLLHIGVDRMVLVHACPFSSVAEPNNHFIRKTWRVMGRRIPISLSFTIIGNKTAQNRVVETN